MKEFDQRLLDKAIKVLTIEYGKAVQVGFIRDPLAFALYQTWRKFDLSITHTKSEIDEQSEEKIDD